MTQPAPDIALAQELFDRLDRATRQGRGIVRDSYGAGEQAAHDIVRGVGQALGLEIVTDPALNLYLTLPGTKRDAPRVIVGSHLDSVGQGGNFDGAAGVVSGLAVLAGFGKAGFRPCCDVTVMAIRAEEAYWFDVPFTGSRAAFGALTPEELTVPRSDSGRDLQDHMDTAGCDVDKIRSGAAYLDPRGIRAYFEVHIEQAPSLVDKEFPVGIVTGIRGDLRYRFARCRGEYGHSGALARAQRRDAVAATVALIHRLDEAWRRFEASGRDLVFTVGELMTDPIYHGPSKVAGETAFVLDMRSTEEAAMRDLAQFAEAEARRIGQERGVIFELGQPSYCAPAMMEANLRQGLVEVARDSGIAAMEMASGAGHDATVFAEQGVPAAMIFIRNRGGSHNPDEEMEIADFAAASRLLSAVLARQLA